MQLGIEEIKKQFPDEWVLLKVNDSQSIANGEVLLHGKDYLELCYKSSEIAQNLLTTIIFTGKTTQNRKWLKNLFVYKKIRRRTYKYHSQGWKQCR